MLNNYFHCPKRMAKDLATFNLILEQNDSPFRSALRSGLLFAMLRRTGRNLHAKTKGLHMKKRKEVVLFSAGKGNKRRSRARQLFQSALGFLKKSREKTEFLAVSIGAIVRIFLEKVGEIVYHALLLPYYVSRGGARISGKLFSAYLRRRKRKQKERARKPVAKPSLLYKLKFFLFGFIMSGVFVFLPLLFLLFISELPSPAGLTLSAIPKTTKIYDRNGNLLYEIYANQNRTIVKLSEIPESLKQATIAIEDKDFYSHPGFDLRGIIRAFVKNVKNEGFQGGSTITQQLIKSAFLSPDPSLIRKVKEVTLAFWAERVYTKDQILELYFNYVPYGGTAWGIESASEIYFGKNVKDLDLAESAFLAGLPRAPSIYSPYSSRDTLWRKRQKEVLDAMVRLHYVTAQDAQKAYEEEFTFKNPQIPIRAPHFVMYVKEELMKQYGISEVERGGLRVKTTLDLPTQEMVEGVVSAEVAQDAPLNIQNGASLVTNPSNGDILAMVGSRSYFDTEHDGNVNLTTALRQPGSTIKLVTYTLALSQGYTESTILDDSPLVIQLAGERAYIPVNYDGAFHGRLPLRLAFGNSFNIPAVRVTQRLGVDNIVAFGRQMGIASWTSDRHYGISITLGGSDVTMIDLATAYGTIANGGRRVTLNPLLEVKDSEGKTLYKKEELAKDVVSEAVAFIISDILADNSARLLEFGQNSALVVPGHRVSVKTGTTDNKRDNWTVGFWGNSLLATTWVGNFDNSPMNQALASGVTGAAPMWSKIMSTLLAAKKDPPLTLPEGVIKKTCNGRDFYFVKGTESSLNCSYFVSPTVTPQP